MNHRPFQPLPSVPVPTASDNDIVLDFGKIFGILKRGWWLITGLGLAGALAAAVIVLNVEPTYRAYAQLLMGQANRPGGALGVLMQDLNLDDDAITGEIAVINSGLVLSKVSARLDLASRPEFNPALRPPEPEPSFLARLSNQAVDQLKGILGVTPPEIAEQEAGGTGAAIDEIETAARIGRASLGDQADYVDQLKRGLQIGRVGNSNLVNVRFELDGPSSCGSGSKCRGRRLPRRSARSKVPRPAPGDRGPGSPPERNAGTA